MHELSIATSICDTVVQEIERQELPPVKVIVLRIGALSDVVPEALEFGFDAIKVDTVLSNTTLKIETVPVSGRCLDCERSFDVLDLIFACPHCNSGQVRVTKGEELEIAYLEVEDS